MRELLRELWNQNKLTIDSHMKLRRLRKRQRKVVEAWSEHNEIEVPSLSPGSGKKKPTLIGYVMAHRDLLTAEQEDTLMRIAQDVAFTEKKPVEEANDQ